MSARPPARGGTATGHVTTVTLIRCAGMLRKHASGRLALTTIARETSMPFAKQLSYPRRLRSPVRPRPASLSLPQIPVTTSPLMIETAARFAAHADRGSPNLLLAILSWVIAEFLAGCAAYAEAIHPNLAIAEDRVNLRDRMPCGPLRLDLQGEVKKGSRPASAVRLPGVSGARPKPMRWYMSISALLMTLLSKLRKAQERRRALMELENLDERTLRDIGISRCDIESITRRGYSRR